ncbi:unnamed protein product [Prorocentrum cordatum]|uniref:Uncharacterized protein n=1 Tax=Prorocentrum cordatum TaxID=2364126 RepID=A0ABN9TYD0_9DINO|nr:unnamed protein product [Polarella glacialis]
MAQNMSVDDAAGESGLTQATGALQLAGAPAPPAELPADLLQELVEESVSKYSELVSAVRATTAGPNLMITSSRIAPWTSLHELLLHLAYLPEAAAALQALADGVRQCTDLIPEIMKVRRWQRAPDLPVWRELGASALGLLCATAPTAAELVPPHWSTLKLSTEAAAAAHPGTRAVDACRRAAALVAKGDDRFWPELGGRPAVLWAPTDSSALGRLLKSYMERPVANGGPPYLRRLVPLELFPGCHTVAAIQDLWWHPVLGERWVGAVKKLEYDITPYSLVLQVHMDLDMNCTDCVLPGATPVFQVAAAPAQTLDFPAEALPQVLRILAGPSLQLVHASAPHRSVLSKAAAKRMSMEWTFPPGTPKLQIELLWRHLRRSSLPPSAFFGPVGLRSDATALICELTAASAAPHAWELRVNMVSLKEDELAAARRTKGGRIGMAAPVSKMTDVQACGSPGYDTLGVYRQLMTHIEQVTWIYLREAISDAPAGCGYGRWLAAADLVAPPGRLRLHLSSEEEATAVREALHGKTIQVGLGRIALQVTSDAQDLPGNGRRRRGARQPASAGH